MDNHDFIVGVPCSKLKDIIDVACTMEHEYIPCTKEDEAVAMAVGAYLVGKNPLVFMQNSGLGNIIDIITSLLKPYGIEIDLLISKRTSPEHHEFMGKITEELLELLEYKTYNIVEQ